MLNEKLNQDKEVTTMADVIKLLRSLDSDEVNQALDKGWSPSMEGLYDDFIDYASSSLSGGSVADARDLTKIADDEDEESQWERIYETSFPESAAEHWLQSQ